MVTFKVFLWKFIYLQSCRYVLTGLGQMHIFIIYRIRVVVLVESKMCTGG
jgi:hypothetical protein